MSRPQFDAFFRAALGTNHPPYGYQCRLACGNDARPDDPDSLISGCDCHSQLIDIPTGLGKTAAVVLAWLWNRIANPDTAPRAQWPCRLVYCLPMRTLVEQTRDEASNWIKNLVKNADDLGIGRKEQEDLKWLADHSPVILMGGEEPDAKEPWDIHPERPAIIIGTQDMLLSRALNRGYGMSRYRWPMHFGLLNNDCLWIFDEVQLMGVGVETSAQLDGFRHLSQWVQNGNCPTWWMSATLDEDRFATVDHPKPSGGWQKMTLGDSEITADGVRERFLARKPVSKADIAISPTTKDNHARELAALIAKKHIPGTLTLVVVNRVPRARKLFETLLRDKKLGIDPSRVALIHSRFRPKDRARHMELLFGGGDRIVIATQAVEAGVDVSARLLITELAPWSSLIQRIGRCNRRGEINGSAEILWIDIQDGNDDLLLPYSSDDCRKAREAIAGLSDAGSQSLRSVHVPETFVVRPVLRRRDLIDLFDTTPDLCGQDLDISRYIRDGDDSDVQFFWRQIPEKSVPAAEKPPERDELCRVSMGEAQKFLSRNTTRTWQWNSLEEVWQAASRARPGSVYLIDADSGGYDDTLGWTGEPKSKPTPHPPADGDADAYRKDLLTFARYWLSLREHTQNVFATMTALAQSLSLEAAITKVLIDAAMWHDAGKAHEVFREMLCRGDSLRFATIWAKSASKSGICQRSGFRHELASALAWLAVAPSDTLERDLVAYLIAAHHGKVRLSIRALPDEKGNPDEPDRLFARGVWHGDQLEPIPPLTDQSVTLDLSLMQMGEGEHGPSWLARMISLRDRFGPFRLAYLETLLRAADMRTSRAESERHIEGDCAVQNPCAEQRKET